MRGGGQDLFIVDSRGGSLNLNSVRRGGVIQNLDDGWKSQPHAIILDLDVVAPESSQVSIWSSVD